MRTEDMDVAQPSELACLPQELRSHNDAQDLLLLQDYVCKLSHAQQTLEATYATLLSGDTFSLVRIRVKFEAVTSFTICPCNVNKKNMGYGLLCNTKQTNSK